MRRAKISEDRLKRVLLQDRMDAPDNHVAVLKSDIIRRFKFF
jgi:septum formation topological specificity factor MinE